MRSPGARAQAAIDAAGAAGILNVFAAGNDGTDNDTRPVRPGELPSPSIIAVAASDDAIGASSFSNYGATSVDLAAPGDFILGPSGRERLYEFLSGTSMAAPHVAGAAAPLVSKDSR